MSTSITGQGISIYPAPDDALSSASKNPVQNKVIDKEITDVKNAIDELDELLVRERLGPNILAGLDAKDPASFSGLTITNNYAEGSITIENTGTKPYASCSTRYDPDFFFQHYLEVGKKYRCHCKVEYLSGTPYPIMAVRGTAIDDFQVYKSSGYIADGEEATFDFVATEYNKLVSLFISWTSSTRNSSVKYSELWIREVIEDVNDYQVDINARNIRQLSSVINLYNPNDPDITVGSFITGYNSNGFVWQTSSTHYESGYIPVNKDDRIYYAYRNSNNEFKYTVGSTIAFYDENKNELITQYPGTVNDLHYIAPINAKYLRLPVNTTLHENMIFIVPSNDEPMARIEGETTCPLVYVPYGKKILFANEFDTVWRGKTWYGYGTSITNTSNEGKYPKYLAAMSGMNFVNKGISGGGIGDLGGYSHGQVYDAICNITDGKLDADLITLETGANDTGADVPLGTIYDTGRTTLSGCLNDCLRYLQENTDAQIVVFCSPASTTVPTTSSHQYYEWASMVEQICHLNRVHYINSDCNLGFAKLSSLKGSQYVVDNIHQTDLGAYIYAENIWKQLKDIPVFADEVPIS